MDQVTFRVEVDVNLTESEEKVRLAVQNIFGDISLSAKPLRHGELLFGESGSRDVLVNFCNVLRRERIRAAARAVLFEGADYGSIRFCLNKQVAFAGHVSFSKESGESPLGPIRVSIECQNPREVIEWLAPRAA